MAGRILPPISAILPLWLVRSMVNWRDTFAVWPALAVSGLSFALVQFYWSNFQESGLVDVIAALASLLAMVAFLKVWRPRANVKNRDQINTLPLPNEDDVEHVTPIVRNSLSVVFKGWSPFLLASVFIFLWSMPAVRAHLTLTILKQPMPWLDHAVLRMPPVVLEPTPEEAIADLNILALPGTAVFLGAIAAALVLGMKPVRIAQTFSSTV